MPYVPYHVPECATILIEPNERWTSDQSTITPITNIKFTTDHDEQILLPVQKEDSILANTDTCDERKYCYISTASYFGSKIDSELSGVKFSVDVTISGVAYISTYRLYGESQNTNQTYVIIGSDHEILDAISLCRAIG